MGEFAFEMPCLQAGQYSICASIAEGTQDDHVQHHWINSAELFEAILGHRKLAAAIADPCPSALPRRQSTIRGYPPKFA
jgi:hypothetical protein